MDGSPLNRTPQIYMIAGEASGDFLGARLMEALTRKTEGKVTFSGIGGSRMESQGLRSLFPYHELSIMGFIEILPHLPQLIRRYRQTCKDILSRRPDMVITIDSPGFNFLIARKLRRWFEKDIVLVHYVAPTVWAYKPERAAKIASIYDHLLLLLPFEKPHFDRAGLPSTFVGHPVIWEPISEKHGAAFRERHGILPATKTICMLPGSRKGELLRHLPVFEQTAAILAEHYPGLTVVMPLGKHLMPTAMPMVENWPVRVVLAQSEHEKQDALTACDVALTKSGTVTLEVARAGLPMVVTYRVSAYSAHKLRRMIRVKYVSLINLILDKPAIPELLQEDCTPEKLAAALEEFLKNEEKTITQRADIHAAMVKLGMGATTSPSDKAADTVLTLLKERRTPDIT